MRKELKEKNCVGKDESEDFFFDRVSEISRAKRKRNKQTKKQKWQNKHLMALRRKEKYTTETWIYLGNLEKLRFPIIHSFLIHAQFLFVVFSFKCK